MEQEVIVLRRNAISSKALTKALSELLRDLFAIALNTTVPYRALSTYPDKALTPLRVPVFSLSVPSSEVYR